MTTEEQIQYWIRLSDYDLETANAMLQTKRYLYVGFMCHQTIEKIFKACYTKLKEATPPYTHKLMYLKKIGEFENIFSPEQTLFIQTLEPLNIEARYPEYKMKIAASLTSAKCIELLSKTKTLQQWTKKTILLVK
ncbi:DNA-binding protein [Bacteroidia bacterium]|nr:DNA-binding protein [Bacteroidia bacterium]